MNLNGQQKYQELIGKRFGERIAAGDAVFQVGAGNIKELPFTIQNEEKKPFSGSNLFVLLQVMKDQGWADPRFFSISQIADSGWQVKAGAKQVRLQSLLQNTVEVFHVFNGGDIEGVEQYQQPNSIMPNMDDVIQVITEQGHSQWLEVDGAGKTLNNWVFDIQYDRGFDLVDMPSVTLKNQLVLLLLEAQSDLKYERSNIGPYAADKDWAALLSRDPVVFTGISIEAELLATRLIQELHIAAGLRVSAEKNSLENVVNDKAEPNMGNKFLSALIDKKYQDRLAVLAVPFKEKQAAHELGALFYPPLKVWFVPQGKDVEAFKQWTPSSLAVGPVASHQDMVDSFAEKMRDLGLDTGEAIIEDGKWHYVSVNTKKNSKKNRSGAYLLDPTGGRDGRAVGVIHNKDSGEIYNWSHTGQMLTPEQRAKQRAEAMARDAANAQELKQSQDIAAEHAAEIFGVGVSAEGHGYVVRKNIPAEGLKQIGGVVLRGYSEFYGESGKTVIRTNEKYFLVPLKDRAGEIRAVQAINEDGRIKTFMRGAQKKGLMTIIGADSLNDLMEHHHGEVAFVEGYATGRSLHLALGIPVVVCFDAGNLESVVSLYSSMFPASMRPILAIDNDQFHIERAIEHLGEKLGVHTLGDSRQLKVRSGDTTIRSVEIGNIKTNGQWVEAAKGSYRVTLELDEASCVDVAIVETILVDGNKARMTFNNRGYEAGKVALATLNEYKVAAAMVTPEFESLDGKPSDWNDLYQREGANAIRSVFAVQLGVRIEARQIKEEISCAVER